MKHFKILLVLILLASGVQSQFTTTDSLRSYIDRYINNSAINAFQNKRLNTALKGLIDQIDSVHSLTTGGIRNVDTLYKVNDTTIAYEISGSTHTFIVPGGEVTDLVIQRLTINGAGTTASPLFVPDVEVKFSTVATLRATTDTLRTGSYIQTNGYYTAGDGGASRYLIVADTAGLGLVQDTAGLVNITGSKWARLVHTGTITITQFGGIGNGTSNDLLAFRKANAFAKAEGGRVKEILGAGPTSSYRLLLRTAVVNEAFLDFNYSNVIWNGNGAKIIFDNDATQSYVKYTDGGGVTGIYRAKESHVSSSAPTKTLSFGNQAFELIQDSVSSGVAYPAWATSTQYYGAHNFVILGYPFTAFPTLPTGKAENVIFKNWDLSAGESTLKTDNSGYWNVNAKAFLSYENISGFTIDNVKFHHILAEVIFGAGFVSVDRLTIKNSQFYNLTEGIALTGNMVVDNNLAHDIGAHFVESSPFEFRQTYTNNEIYNVPAAITIGAYGAAADHRGYVTIANNKIHDCQFGINLTFRSRGSIVTYNTLTDVATGINIYANNGLYEDASSDISILNNTFESYATSPSIGISFGNTNSNANYKTSNVTVIGNSFGQSKQSKIDGFSTHITNPIQFYGNHFENITVMSNTNYFDETQQPLITKVSSTFEPYVAYNYTSINEIDLTEYYTKKWTLKSSSNNFKLVNRASNTDALTFDYSNNFAYFLSAVNAPSVYSPGLTTTTTDAAGGSALTLRNASLQNYTIQHTSASYTFRNYGANSLFFFNNVTGAADLLINSAGHIFAGLGTSTLADDGNMLQVKGTGSFVSTSEGGGVTVYSPDLSKNGTLAYNTVSSAIELTTNNVRTDIDAGTAQVYIRGDGGINLVDSVALTTATGTTTRAANVNAGGVIVAGARVYGSSFTYVTGVDNYTIVDSTGVIYWNATAGGSAPFTLTIPDPALNPGRRIVIKNGMTSTITLSRGILFLAGSPGRTTLLQDESIEIMARPDGSNWYQIAANFIGH